jgi:ADP-heptose:LPS heptosyltransferase
LRVVLVWAGNPTFRNDRYRFRSIDLAQFAPLFEVEGVHFYSLQLGPETAQLASAPGQIVDLASLTMDMADSAAAIERMDLVISVDTSVAHLAGGLAVPTWIPMPKTPDWRWLLDREDSPWYPEMRLFRQSEPGEWAPVLRQIKVELEALVQGRKTSSRG